MNYLGYSPKRKFKLNDIIPTEHDLEFRGQIVHGHVRLLELQCRGVGGHVGHFQMPMISHIMQMFL